MTKTTKCATLRVLNNNVGLGGGLSLPLSDYDETITEMVVMMHGQQVGQISRAAIYLRKSFLQSIGLEPRPNSFSAGIEGDFTPSFLNHDITEV